MLNRIDFRRFRPNLRMDIPDTDHPFPEQAWVGKVLSIGSVKRQIDMTCPRCSMTTHGFDDLPRDTEIMRKLVANSEGNLGNAHKEGTQYLSSVGAYQRAIALKPDYPNAHNNLAAVRSLLGDPASALSTFQRAVVLRLSATQSTAAGNVVRKTIDLSAPVVVPSDYCQTRDTQ